MHKSLGVVAASAVILAVVPGVTTSPAQAASAKKFSNCAALNKVYPHGVGRPGAHDKVTSGDPVTNFTRNKKVYKQNKKGRDRDKDGIACEKH